MKESVNMDDYVYCDIFIVGSKHAQEVGNLVSRNTEAAKNNNIKN